MLDTREEYVNIIMLCKTAARNILSISGNIAF